MIKASEAANAQIAAGADFILQLGESFETCKQKNIYCFGNYVDLNTVAPEVIPTSTILNWDPQINYLIGQWRDQQNGKSIDATGEVIQTDDIDGVYDGAVELADALAGSTQVQECVASQWFRFAYNRTVTQEDSCSVEQLNDVFRASNFNVKALLVALTQTNAFLYRRAVELESDATGGGQ